MSVELIIILSLLVGTGRWVLLRNWPYDNRCASLSLSCLYTPLAAAFLGLTSFALYVVGAVAKSWYVYKSTFENFSYSQDCSLSECTVCVGYNTLPVESCYTSTFKLNLKCRCQG